MRWLGICVLLLGKESLLKKELKEFDLRSVKADVIIGRFYPKLNSPQ
jgi:hypothetical protein